MPLPETRARTRKRKGIAKLWLILLLPAIIIFLCVVVEVANLWIARAELENALEAAALAAVKEWGDANGTGNTLAAREIGRDYGYANDIRDDIQTIANPNSPPAMIDVGLQLDLNRDDSDPVNNPNENDVCPLNGEVAGPPILVFGAITDLTPGSVTFNAGQRPSCGVANVLFDATGQGGGIGGGLSADNAWGIAFYDEPDTPAALRITSIEIDLRATAGSTGRFITTPRLSDDANPTVSDPAVVDTNGVSQPDVRGFVITPGVGMPPSPPTSPEIAFTLLNTDGGTGPNLLRIDFMAAGGGNGFAKGERLRFGVDVDGVAPASNGTNDGDGIGIDQVGVRIVFNSIPDITSNFSNTGSKQTDCTPDFDGDNLEPIITHPTHLRHLPCSRSSSVKNDGQSYVLAGGGGSGEKPFAVHAQGRVQVRSVCGNLFGLTTGTFTVKARTTAIYDCEDRVPRLIRLDQFICP